MDVVPEKFPEYRDPQSGWDTPHRSLSRGKVLPYTLNPESFYPLLYKLADCNIKPVAFTLAHQKYGASNFWQVVMACCSASEVSPR
jgi:hypothetical protein